jgi:hypothetical protein
MNNPNQQRSRAHITNLNFNNFKIIEAMGLRIIDSRSPSTAFHENLPSGSEVISGDRQTDRLVT